MTPLVIGICTLAAGIATAFALRRVFHGGVVLLDALDRRWRK